MKKLLFLCGLLIVYVLNIHAQKTVKHDSLPSPIKEIYFDKAFRTDTLSADTSMLRLHMMNPASNISPWYSYLTRSGYPIEWLQFTERGSSKDYFYPAWFVSPYISAGNNNYFYQTRRQFSNLSYKTIAADNNNEEQLLVLHTQNLTKKSNIGLQFNMNGNQMKMGLKSSLDNASDNALDIFYRYSGENYKGFYRFYYNSVKLNETGGLLTDSSFQYNTANAYGTEVKLNGAKSNFRKTGFVMAQQLDIKKYYSIINNDTASKDSVLTRKKTFGSLIYVLGLETNKRTYKETQTEKLFYSNFYSRNGVSSDSITMDKLSNKIILQSPFLIKYLPDLSVAICNDLYKARFGIDSSFFSGQYQINHNNTGSFQQTYVSANARQTFGYIDWNFSWDSYLLGYGIGDQEIRIVANLYANQTKTLALQLNAGSSLKTPSFMLVRNFSNHINYNYFDKLKREKKQEISGSLKFWNKTLELSGSYELLNDYLYFDTAALPTQAPQLNIISGSLSSELSFWKFYTINKAVIQKTDANKYLHIPDLLLFHSLNFQHTFHFRSTGGRLFTQLGYDITWTSAYKAAAFMPATGVFYLQNQKEIGNYAKIDVHLSMKVKTVSFFVKLTHLNSIYSNRQFTALHYQMMPMTFSYGINWLFYD